MFFFCVCEIFQNVVKRSSTESNIIIIRRKKKKRKKKCFLTMPGLFFPTTLETPFLRRGWQITVHLSSFKVLCSFFLSLEEHFSPASLETPSPFSCSFVDGERQVSFTGVPALSLVLFLSLLVFGLCTFNF